MTLEAGLVIVRFLVKSDTHDFDYFTKNAEQPFRQGRGPTDIDVLNCGDLTTNGSPYQLEQALIAIGSIDGEIRLVISGNHEVSLDTAFFTSQGGEATECKAAKTLVDELREKGGVQVLQEGIFDFTLKSGANFSIYASPYTPNYGVSAFQYDTSHDRFYPQEHVLPWATSTTTATSIIHAGTDIVLTHGPPKYILDTTADGSSGGCERLRRAICGVRPRMHCFGNVHGGYGIQRAQWLEPIPNPREANHEADRQDQCKIKLLAAEFVGKNQANNEATRA